MDKKTAIESKVEAVMNSLNGIQSASPGAFFYTRVQAKLQKEDINIWNRIGSLVARPAIAVTVVCLILLMNILVIVQQKAVSPLADQTEQSSYYDELNKSADNFYDFAINEP
ncbi:MAG: hypothetical protein INR73_24485 [Williamsia sp.]|nr:hypothetical protein [Williamsia sp.]